MKKTRRNLPRPARCRKGQLKVKWAALKGEDPDICVSWGDDVPKGSGRMIYSLMRSKNYSPIYKKFGPSFIEKLEEWGFDIKTLRFEITHKDYSNEN